MSKRNATVYIIRHGQKQSDVPNEAAQLTDEGERQVMRVAAGYLSGMPIGLLLSSNYDRAADAAAIAHFFSGNGVVYDTPTPTRLIELGFDGLPVNEYPAFAERAKEYAVDGQQMTLADIEETMPMYISAARERFGAAVVQVAVELAGSHSEEYAALIGCHSPLTEILALDPNTPALGEAGLMKYTYEVDGDQAELVESECVFAGY